MTALRDEPTLTAIGQQAFDQDGQATRPTFSYYRKADGFLTVDVVSEMEELHYRREGWEPLAGYGRFDMTTEYMANHPFEALFMNGGASEMPAAQVIEYGFHINPPEVPGCGKLIDQNHPRHKPACWSLRYQVSFPQIEGLGAKAWPCDYCAGVRPTKAALDNHMEAMHREERGDIRTSQSLAAAIVSGLNGGVQGGPTPAVEETSSLALTALQKLAGIGLNQKQRAALAELGIDIAQAEESDDEPA